MNINKAIVSALAIVSIAACSSNGDTVRLNPNPTGAPATMKPTQAPTNAPPSTTTTYTQIERLSRPAIKEVFEPFQDHQKSNAVEPYNDPTIQNDIKVTEDALRPPATFNGMASDYGAGLAGVLYPDEYSVNLAGATPATTDSDPELFLSNDLDKTKFGGRSPDDDVIALELGVLFGGTLAAVNVLPEDNQENTCLSAQNITQAAGKHSGTTFPYLPAPH